MALVAPRCLLRVEPVGARVEVGTVLPRATTGTRQEAQASANTTAVRGVKFLDRSRNEEAVVNRREPRGRLDKLGGHWFEPSTAHPDFWLNHACLRDTGNVADHLETTGGSSRLGGFGRFLAGDGSKS